jgi:hypothetical protein
MAIDGQLRGYVRESGVVATMYEREAPGDHPHSEHATSGIRRRLAIVAAPVIVVLCVGLAFLVREQLHTHPRAFPPLDNTPIFWGPAKLNQPYHVGTLLQSDFEISGITPIVSPNSAPAATTVTVCRGARTTVLGVAPFDLAAACKALLVPKDIRLRPNDIVVVTIVPLRAGVIDVPGVRVSLRGRSQRWHEDTGTFVRLTAR